MMNRIMSAVIRLAVPVMIVLTIVIFIPAGRKKSNEEVTAEGIAYVRAEESRDVSGVDSEIRKRMAAEETGQMDLWEKLNFYDTYLMGDSRVEPFIWTGLNPDHVFADKSTTVKYVGERIEDIRSAAPGNLVLSFGMNDLGMYIYDPVNYWETGQEYAEEFGMYIDMIREASPNTNIYINSIIPALAAGIERQDRWLLAEDWNTALIGLCREKDVTYIDTTYIAYDYADYFDDDGVHFYGEGVFDAWGESILEAIESRIY